MTNKPIKIVRNRWITQTTFTLTFVRDIMNCVENTVTLVHLVTCPQRSTQHCFRLGFHHDLYA